MFVGHYAVALAAKRLTPRTNLGWLFAAAQLVDLIWPFLLLLGIEHVEIKPGDTAFTPLAFTHYPYTHSLLMGALWGVLLGGLYFILRHDRRGALVIGAVVLSHWILDLVTHRPDLQIAPGIDDRLGLGLWNNVTLTVVIESLMFLAGLWVYINTSRAKDKAGKYGFWSMIIVLMFLHAANIIGSPPPDTRSLALFALTGWIVPFWAGWADSHREAVLPVS